MQRVQLIIFGLLFLTNNVFGQKERLDFASTYFEIGTSLFPSFDVSGTSHYEGFQTKLQTTSYLNWGAYHFWGKAEIYVTIPLSLLKADERSFREYQLIHSVATGARFFPWRFEEGKVRPYLGLSWSALDFHINLDENEEYPIHSKNFEVTPEFGLVYGKKGFALRVGTFYFPDSEWNYPSASTQLNNIKTPPFNIQVGLRYSYDSSRGKNKETNKRWNSFSTFSAPGINARRPEEWFVGVGPSTSFTLTPSTYTRDNLPYLEDQVSSGNYFDLAVGLVFNDPGILVAASFRNPEYESKGLGSVQRIKKQSLAMELMKYIVDYSGFAPYVGINLALDQIVYQESTRSETTSVTSHHIEPGFTLGWDIMPGKSEEFLVLRTNLRWYPMQFFEVNGRKFSFSQLEYNLIQAVFYPGRIRRLAN